MKNRTILQRLADRAAERTRTADAPLPRRTTTGARHRAATLPRATLAVRGAVACIALGLSVTGGTASADSVTVAFTGDQSTYEGARDVLALVRDEGADLLVVQGDLGYESPSRWIANNEEILGAHFPVLAVVGNHEAVGWPTYRAWLERRVSDVPDLHCEGRIGIKAHCTFRGLSIVQSAPGISEVPGVAPDDDYAGHIARTLADDSNAWRVCSWHKQQGEMQVGGKYGDATGWAVYEACREGGAIVATAHEHSYSRTFLMSDFSELSVAHRGDHLEIGPGRTFAFVSGLGGNSVRPQLGGGDWWASIYTATQGATYGALFCTFEERTASCRFKAIDGAVPDRFTLETRNTRQATDGTVDAPEGLEARVYSTSAAELFWRRADAPGMRYDVTRDGGLVTTTDGTSHFADDLSAGRTYAYEVVAIDPEGRRSAPAGVTVRTAGDGVSDGVSDGATDATTPPAPYGLEARVYSTSAAELFWTRSDTPGMRYDVTRDGSFVTITDGTSHFADDLSAGRAYAYVVVAIDPEGRRSAPASVTVRTSGDGASVEPTPPPTSTGDPAGAESVTLGTTVASGAIEVRLAVYDRRSYELIWARVPGVARYRLSRSGDQVVQDGEKVSRYFPGIDSSAVTDYRIEAIDADGRTIRDTRIRVAPRLPVQLVSLD